MRRLPLASFCAALAAISILHAQDSLIPSDSVMGKAAADRQRVLLSAVEQGGVDAMWAFNLDNLSAAPFAGVEPKAGLAVLKFFGEAKAGGGKGDFGVKSLPSGQVEQIGAWIYIADNANASRVGFQVEDAEGEWLSFVQPVDWTGWRWMEADIAGAFAPAYEQKDKNGRVDLPLKNIHVIWFAKTEGPTFIGVDGLAAVTKSEGQGTALSITPLNAPVGEPNQPFTAQLLINNPTDKEVDLTVDWSLQTNPQLWDKSLPDPVLGSDIAQGKKSWVEVAGQRVENNTLTDGEDDTNWEAGWGVAKFGETTQTVDLGEEHTITGLGYKLGDANWIFRVDISASTDGTNFTPVSGLQDLNLFQKFGGPFPIEVKEPFKARYIRLSYRDDGQKREALRAPTALYVYDGVADEKIDLPQTGAKVEGGSLKIKVGAKNFAIAPLASKTPLKTGGYLFGVKVEGTGPARLFTSNYFVRSDIEVKLRPESRFGMNGATPSYIPELQRLGTGWMRFENIKWMMFSSAPDQFAFEPGPAPWSLPFDTYLRQYQAASISVLPYIFQTPDWATKAPADITRNRAGWPPKEKKDYGEAMFQLAARYGSKTHPADQLLTPDKKSGLGLLTVYELWNEPNLVGPDWAAFVGPFEEYLEVFRAGAEGTKRGDPKAVISSCGFAGLSLDIVDKFHSYKYSDGKTPLDFTDIMNVHFYSGREEPEYVTSDPNVHRDKSNQPTGQTYEKDLLDLSDWRDDLKPGMPVWLTETGNDVGGPIGRSERYQAAKIPRVIMIALATCMEKVFLYRESGSDPAMHAGAGVLRNDGSLRPSYFTLATLIRQLDGVPPGRVLRLQAPDSRAWMYRWKKGGDSILTAWVPEGTEKLGLNLGKCTVTDAFGGVTEMEVKEDFPLSIFPVYITKISNSGPIDALEKAAQTREADRQKDRARVAKAEVRLFQFGSKEPQAIKTIGFPRPYTAVFAADIYSDEKGYGFEKAVNGKDDFRPWIETVAEKGNVRIFDPAVFAVKVAPGIYDLELRAEDFRDVKEVTVSGVQEGDVILKPDERGRVKTKVTALKDQPIRISLPGGDLKLNWLTLVQAN